MGFIQRTLAPSAFHLQAATDSQRVVFFLVAIASNPQHRNRKFTPTTEHRSLHRTSKHSAAIMSAQASSNSKVDEKTASSAPADKGKGKAPAEDVSMGEEEDSHSEGESEPEETVSVASNPSFSTSKANINVQGRR
jgi:hypothetical protein